MTTTELERPSAQALIDVIYEIALAAHTRRVGACDPPAPDAWADEVLAEITVAFDGLEDKLLKDLAPAIRPALQRSAESSVADQEYSIAGVAVAALPVVLRYRPEARTPWAIDMLAYHCGVFNPPHWPTPRASSWDAAALLGIATDLVVRLAEAEGKDIEEIVYEMLEHGSAKKVEQTTTA